MQSFALNSSWHLFCRILCLAFVVFMTGCGKPYSMKISSISYPEGPDKPSIIQMSDPTIYSRETLINDRLREREYLLDVLEASKSVQFEAEIKRELLSIAQLSTQLGLGLDPARAEEYARALELSNQEQSLNLRRLRIAEQQLSAQNRFDLSGVRSNSQLNELVSQRDTEQLLAQIEQTQLQNRLILTQMQTELLRAREDLENLREGEEIGSSGDDNGDDGGNGDDSGGGDDDGGDDSGGNNGSGNPQLSSVSSGLTLTDPTLLAARSLSGTITTGDFSTALSRLDERVTALSGLITQSITPAVGSDTSLTPEADFAARQAYRRTIRSAIAVNELDDQHDADGNSLYRLQFMATIFPKEKDAQWNVARYHIFPPKLNKTQSDDLYIEWLQHLSYRMNSRTNKEVVDRYHIGSTEEELLSAGTGLFEIARIYLDVENNNYLTDECVQTKSHIVAEQKKCDWVALAVPPGAGDYLTSPLGSMSDLFLKKIAEKLRYVDTNDIKDIHEFMDSDRYGESGSFCESKLASLLYLSKIYFQNISKEIKDDLDKCEEKKLKSKWAKDLEVLEAYYSGEKVNICSSDKCENSGQAKKTHVKNEIANKSGRAVFQGILEELKELDIRDLITNREIVKFVLKEAVAFDELAPTVSRIAQGIEGRYDLKLKQIRHIQSLTARFNSGAQASRVILRYFCDPDVVMQNRRSLEGCNKELYEKFVSNYLEYDTKIFREEFNFDRAQKRFKCILTGDQNCRDLPDSYCPVSDQKKCAVYSKNKTNLARGNHFVYLNEPIERSQRISTVATAAEAFELALAFSAQAPASGIGGNGGLQASRSAVGKLQARENAPLVVGFSGPSEIGNSNCAGEKEENCCANFQSICPEKRKMFGWVFGPRLVLDAKENELKLEQFLGTQDVSVDISMPGWWPYVELQLETVRIGKWDNGRIVEPNCKGATASSLSCTKTVEVQLPRNRADFDGLTNHVAKVLLGRNLRQTRITRVTPTAVSRCRSTETVLIYGKDVWRGSEIFLDGIPAKPGTISVLPDMEGVRASFDMNQLRKRSSANKKPRLVLWTRNGFQEYPMEITGGFKDGICTDEPAAKPDDPPNFAITSISPSKISECQSKVTFITTIKGIEKPHAYFTGSNDPLKEVKPCITDDNKEEDENSENKCFKVKFNLPSLNSFSGFSSFDLIISGAKNGKTLKKEIGFVPNKKCSTTSQTPIVNSITSADGDDLDGCQSRAVFEITGQGLDAVKKVTFAGKEGEANRGRSSKEASFRFLNLPALKPGGSGRWSLKILDGKGQLIKNGEKSFDVICEKK